MFFRANEQSDVIKQTNVKRGLKFACCSDRFIENYKLQKKSLKQDSCNDNNNNHQRGKIWRWPNLKCGRGEVNEMLLPSCSLESPTINNKSYRDHKKVLLLLY